MNENNTKNNLLGGNTMIVNKWEQQFNVNKNEIMEKINACKTNIELYEYLYEISKYYGPDILWDNYDIYDIIIAFWGDFKWDNNDECLYSPYVSYANFIGYNG